MKKTLFLFALIGLLISCKPESSDNNHSADSKEQIQPEEPKVPEIKINKDTLLTFSYQSNQFDVQIRVPESDPIGTIMVLQGWNFPITDWCSSTTLCEKALKQGYVLVMPDMGKSIYAYRSYAQTRDDWRKYPTRKWLTRTVIPALQKDHSIFVPGQNNYVMGLSTGGRGALLVAMDLPDVFAAVATISGDYDHSRFPSDNLYRGYFGSEVESWPQDENPIMMLDQLKAALYVGHGERDKIVPLEHMVYLQEAINSSTKEHVAEFHVDRDGEHNYLYWNSEVNNILSFFEAHR